MGTEDLASLPLLRPRLPLARRQPEDLQTAWEDFLAAIPWTTAWTLNPRGLIYRPDHALALAVNILKVAQSLLGLDDLGAVLVAERDASRVYHLHALVAGHLEPAKLDAIAARWGHSHSERYRPGGGFVAYMAKKLAAGLEFSLFGELERRESADPN